MMTKSAKFGAVKAVVILHQLTQVVIPIQRFVEPGLLLHAFKTLSMALMQCECHPKFNLLLC